MVRGRVDRGGEAALQPLQTSLNIAEIRQLITLMSGSDIDEIEIEQGTDGVKLALRKAAPVYSGSSDDFDEEADDGIDGASHADTAADNEVTIGAPLVGIFRTSMKPGGKALVQPGDIVRQGQIIAAIEALNVLNEVEATESGRVSEVLVSSGQPVEYGQPLMVIEPQRSQG